MSKWLVKRNQPAESIMAIFDTEEEAQERADLYNFNYQTDNYYVEAYDPQKAQGFYTAINTALNTLRDKKQ